MGPRLFSLEIRKGQTFGDAVGLASMEPLFSAWKFRRDFGFLAAPDGFNGATSFQTWKYDVWQRCTGAPGGASMGPRLFRRGNNFDGCFSAMFIVASMGPRLFRRGNLSNSKRRRKGSGCFNGSTSFQTWKCQDPPRKPERTRCFNGSTSFQTWKSDMLSSIALCCGGLQWGHVFSDVEISLPREAGSVKNLSHIY